MENMIYGQITIILLRTNKTSTIKNNWLRKPETRYSKYEETGTNILIIPKYVRTDMIINKYSTPVRK